MHFAVSKLKIDLSSKEGEWHLGLDKLNHDLDSNTEKFDMAQQDYSQHMENLSNDLTALHSDTEFLQNQVYGGLGVAGILALVLIVAGISLCCFLSKKLATFVRV